MKAITTTITIAMATFIAATAAFADITAKGGATALSKGTVVQPGNAAPAAAMNCPKCKSQMATVAVPGFKANEPKMATIQRHGCGDCGTKWVTTGHGKAKVETAVHTCGGCKS